MKGEPYPFNDSISTVLSPLDWTDLSMVLSQVQEEYHEQGQVHTRATTGITQ